MIEKWKKILELDEWDISTDSISNEQVYYPEDLDIKEFIGISIDHKQKYGLINHTRPLTDFDVVHELLHVKYPIWSEDQVNDYTHLTLFNNIQ